VASRNESADAVDSKQTTATVTSEQTTALASIRNATATETQLQRPLSRTVKNDTRKRPLATISWQATALMQCRERFPSLSLINKASALGSIPR